MNKRVCPEKIYDPLPVPFEVGDVELGRHPIAQQYALILDTISLAKSIQERGVNEHITLLDGMVLEGWSRYLIARAQGKVCYAIRFEDTKEARAARGNRVLLQRTARQYFFDKNFARNHYTMGQRAWVAYHLANARQGERTDLLEPSADHQPIITQAEAGKMLGVPTEQVSRAGRVAKEGTEEQKAAVKSGKPLDPILLGLRWKRRHHRANLRRLSHYAAPNGVPFICGDSLVELRKRDANSIDGCITDPPYGIKIHNQKWDKEIPPLPYWQELFRVLKPGAYCVAFSHAQHYHKLASLLCEANFIIQDMVYWVTTYKFLKTNHLKPAHEPICVAQKPYEKSLDYNMRKWGVGRVNFEDAGLDDSGPNTQSPHNVVGYVNEPELQKYFYTPRVTEEERGYYNNHPSVKPIALMKWLIRIFVPDNSIVLDPFMGTGTTGLAAIEAGRRFVGIEIDPHYISIACRRFAEQRKLVLSEAPT